MLPIIPGAPAPKERGGWGATPDVAPTPARLTAMQRDRRRRSTAAQLSAVVRARVAPLPSLTFGSRRPLLGQGEVGSGGSHLLLILGAGVTPAAEARNPRRGSHSIKWPPSSASACSPPGTGRGCALSRR